MGAKFIIIQQNPHGTHRGDSFFSSSGNSPGKYLPAKIVTQYILVNFDKSPKLTFLDDRFSIYPDEAIGQNV